MLQPVNSLPAIFKPITTQIIPKINHELSILEAEVFLDRQFTKQIKLILTSFCLGVSSPHLPLQQCSWWAQLQFSIKFEILFEPNLSTLPQKKRKFSKKVGFRIIKQKNTHADFYFTNQPLLDVWVKHLAKNVCQHGFDRFYRPIKKIDSGGYATVYEVQRISDRQRFAVKAFSKAATTNSQNPINRQILLNQIAMLRTFNSPNIIKLQAVFQSQHSLYIVLQLFLYGQLNTIIKQTMSSFTQKQIQQFLRGLAKGLCQIHRHKIMHRDIKPNNIMIRGREGLEPVIADFGLSAYVEAEDYIYYRCGTPGYVAPEVMACQKGDKLSTACDIFSAGCILHILLLKKPLFKGKSAQQVFQNNKMCAINLDSSAYNSINPLALDLLKRMLRINPEERITAEDMLLHPFLRQVQKMEGQKQVVSPKTSVGSKKKFVLFEENKQF